MQSAPVLTRDDLTPDIIPSANKVVTSLGIYNRYNALASEVNRLSAEQSNLPTKAWINDQNYLTSHQSISHKLNKSEFASISSTFLTAHQSLSALNNYYTKNETSSAAQLKTAFNRGIDRLSIDFAQIYNNAPDKWLSAYVGGDISSTFIEAVNRINEIDIYCAFDDITTLTDDLEYEDISILSAPTILICQHAGIARSKIDVDTIEGIAAALNQATTKLKVFGTSTTLNKMLRTYMIRNRVLEFQLAILAAKVKKLQTKDSEELAALKVEFTQLKSALSQFADALKINILPEDAYVYEIADKVNETISSRNEAADILNLI